MRALLFALVVVSAVGCKKKEEAVATKAAETKPAETKPAEAPAPATPPAAEAKAPEAPPAEAVDVCSFITKEQIEASMGKVTGDPMKQPAQGSFLGGCQWMAEKGSAIVTVRPANEYDATAAMGKGTDVAGLGEKASMTKTGLLVKVAGKPYFFHIMTMSGTKMDNAKAEEIGKLAVAGAK